MKLSKDQIQRIKEARLDFLWKVELFSWGLNWKKEENERIKLLERLKTVVEYEMHLIDGEEEICDKKVEELDEKEFAYQLGKHIQTIAGEVIRCFSEVVYPLDALIEDYESKLKEILL